MHQDNRHILWERDDHPSPELLQQYQEGTLPDALHHQLERHLLDCDLCSDVLEGLAVSDAGTTDANVKAINRRIAAKSRRKKRKPVPMYLTDWRVAAAMAMVLLSTIVVFYYNYQQLRQQETGIATSTDKALRESLDLSEKLIASPERVADAVPDTVRPQIALNHAPKPRLERPAPAVPPMVTQEQETFENTESEAVAAEVALLDKLAVASPEKLTESVKAPLFEQRNAFIPESASVAKALQGRVAGVNVQNRAGSANSVELNTVQGQVISTEGQPLPGVTVTVKGTTTGVATDAQGNFSLRLPKDNATLLFRYIGYETKEKAVTANTESLTVDMQVDTRSLSEVVVTRHRTPAPTTPAAVVTAKPGIGHSAYRKYLEENIRFTDDIKKGRVVVQATVMPSGALQNLQVVRSNCPDCEQEALRLIAQGPTWTPATRDGNSIEQQVRIVVRFNPAKKK
jgi:TonB family protein